MSLSTDHKSALLAKLQTRDAHVAVVGLGYVGLPLAVAFAEAGFRVTGIDIDRCKVDQLCHGNSYIPDVGSVGLRPLVTRGLLSATTDYAAVTQCDEVSLCVPPRSTSWAIPTSLTLWPRPKRS